MYPVRIVKMVTGETLIAGIADSVNPHGDQGVYTLEEPMTIVQIPTRKRKGMNMGETIIFMKRWLELSQDVMFIVPKNSVVCVALPDASILKDYNSAKASMLEDETVQDDDEDEEDGDDDQNPPPESTDGDGTPPRFQK